MHYVRTCSHQLGLLHLVDNGIQLVDLFRARHVKRINAEHVNAHLVLGVEITNGNTGIYTALIPGT